MAPLVASLLLLSALASVEESGPGYLVDTWTAEEGLPQNSVQAILQPRDGYLWLGTYKGVARFDGIRFVPVASLTDLPVVLLYEARDGAVWIGTDAAGIARWKDGETRTYSPSSGATGTVYTIAEDEKGQLWAGTSDGLAYLDGER